MKKEPVPYYQLPVYRTCREYQRKIIENKTVESIPKDVKKDLVAPMKTDIREILTDIYEVRELEKQLQDESFSALPEEWQAERIREIMTLLAHARRKAARCIICVRSIYDTHVHAQDSRRLLPEDLYQEYSSDLVSTYRQLGFWAGKYRKMIQSSQK